MCPADESFSAPAEVIDLPGLRLRRHGRDDAEGLYAAVLRSGPQLRPWMPWAHGYDLAAAHRYCAHAHEAWEAGREWLYALLDGDEVIGSVGVRPAEDPGVVDIGYWVASDHAGRGVATAATAALLQQAAAMDGVAAAQVRHDRANAASRAVPERLGLRLVDEASDVDLAPAGEGITVVWRTATSDLPPAVATAVRAGPRPRPRARPHVDPAVAAALAPLAPADAGLTPERIVAFRAELDGMRPDLDDLIGDRPLVVREHQVPGLGRPALSALTVARTGASPGRPAILHLHGGGLIAGHRLGSAQLWLDWAERLDVTVCSVEYRLAPEHPHPAAVEDAYDALCWLADHAEALDVDPDRLVVAGSSAGGGLAAQVALRARDRGGPRLAGQVLSAPMLDDRSDSPSMWQVEVPGTWSRQDNLVAWDAVLGGRAGDPALEPAASPARAERVDGLPPAVISVGSADALRDEAIAYAQRLWAAGGQAELAVWPGGVHGFEGLAPDAPVSRAAQAYRLEAIRRLLGEAG